MEAAEPTTQGSHPANTHIMYYEKGIPMHATGKPLVFDRLYNEARKKSADMRIATAGVDSKRVKNASTHTRPSAPARPAPQLHPTAPSHVPVHSSTLRLAPKVLHSYVNLTASLPTHPVLQSYETYQIPPAKAKRPLTASQTVKVIVTTDIRVPPPNRVELRPVRPEVPDFIPMESLYQKLVHKPREPTDPILTPHYAQLSPTVRNYGFSAGCQLGSWEEKVKRTKSAGKIVRINEGGGHREG